MLEIKNLNAWWGSAQALFNVTLSVNSSELVVLQGLNGAGKSTLLQSVMGCGPTVQGALTYQNQSIDALPSHRRALAGLGYVAEDRRLFTNLSVRENLHIAARGQIRQNEAMVLSLFPALAPMLNRSASQMSGGEQQMLAIARTLMGSPTLLLLDEPCEGIAPVLVESILAALLSLKAQGIAMLVVEQNQVLAARADRVVNLTAGTLAPQTLQAT